MKIKVVIPNSGMSRETLDARRRMLSPALRYAADQKLTVKGEAFGLYVFTDYSQPVPLDYVALYLPVD